MKGMHKMVTWSKKENKTLTNFSNRKQYELQNRPGLNHENSAIQPQTQGRENLMKTKGWPHNATKSAITMHRNHKNMLHKNSRIYHCSAML
jgi:hypothetical protein